MNLHEIRKALLETPGRPKELRTNDGRVFVIRGVEQWALGLSTLVVMAGPRRELNVLSVRNIASIGPARGRRSRTA